jgi:hypothetical protein
VAPPASLREALRAGLWFCIYYHLKVSQSVPAMLGSAMQAGAQRDTEVQATSQAESPQEIAGNADEETMRP